MAELVAKGQTLTILGLDLPATGNYSCWASGVLLDTTYVVVRVTGTWGRGKGGPAQPCGTAGRGWMQGVWGQVGAGNSSLARGDEGGSCHSLQGGRCSARGCRTLGSPATGPACPCCLGKGHHSSAPADPNHCPLAPPGEEEAKNVSCQADSYRGSFRCSWTGPRSAVFRARLMRRWVPATLAPAPWAPSAHARLASQ